MKKDSIFDIEEQISDVLKKKKKAYLTLTQLRNNLPASVLRHFGLIKTKATPLDVLKKLKPYLGKSMWEYKGSRSVYIGYQLTREEIILNKIRQSPGLSTKNLAKDLPMTQKVFIATLNRLLEIGVVICIFNEHHTPLLKASELADEKLDAEKKRLQDRAAFKSAIKKLGNGSGFVRIHRIREYLDWQDEHFNHILKCLMADYTIELHGGDPSIMTETEIQNSFTDDDGLLYINLTWWGNEHGEK